ncbi:cyclic lactone autoinducer peptide [Oscillospiraceae bacterium OttesenSCG-928-G22]|nr:cyclic lactone autoinducer peptide [Oscillospiraceae bacterium OttesenSCG-928-G22]
MKKITVKAMTILSSVAMCAAFSILSTICRTWFFEPKVPQSLLDLQE